MGTIVSMTQKAATHHSPPVSPLTVFIISDSSGETAAHVAHAAVSQFSQGIAIVKRLPQVRTREQVQSLVEEINSDRCLIAYTLVLPDFRATLESAARSRNVPAVDLLGPLLERVAELTLAEPLSEPGRSHLLDDAYFMRMEAVNFAVHLDDGVHPERLDQADVVLIGVSRASKTPNCLYLAQHYGLKAANVPLVYGIPPPTALKNLNREKIIGLHIDPHVLHSLRTSRAQAMKIAPQTDYAELDRIADEVDDARRVFRQLGCYVVDVSRRAIEETSSEISLYLARTRNGKILDNKEIAI